MNSDNKTNPSLNKDNPKSNEVETLLEFPCEFALKIMGRNHTDFIKDMCGLVQNYIKHEIQIDTVQQRPSRSGKYTAITISIKAESKPQLDQIYQALYEHDDVKMTL